MIDYIEDLKKEMEKLGFRWQDLRLTPYEPGLFYKKIVTKRPCVSNDKDQLTIRVFDWYEVPENIRGSSPTKQRFSLTAEICGAFMLGFSEQWAKMEIYNLSPEDVMGHYERIEQSLIRSWEALS
jgi:hypothetical protein